MRSRESRLAVGVARGILLRHSKSTLDDLQLNLTRGGVQQVLGRMGFTKRRTNSKAKIIPHNSEEIKRILKSNQWL